MLNPIRSSLAGLPILVILAACASNPDAGSSSGSSSSGDGTSGGGAGDGGAEAAVAASYTDGVKNGDESDVDCGGGAPVRCATGLACNGDGDCDKAKCDPSTKKCLAPSSSDGIKNGTETDVDCGGSAPTNAPKCEVGKGCASNDDCNGIACDKTTKKCDPATSSDGIENGTETDVDCGGGAPTNAPKCDTGKACGGDADCNDVRCATDTKKCASPTSSDGLTNGTETDVDCGGAAPTNAPKCAVGMKCKAPSDCTTDGCGYDGKCVLAPSCAPQNGGDTCGKREVGQAGQTHESCCASLPLSAGLAVDKYEITAGRMREFIKRTNGDVAGWVASNSSLTRAGISIATQIPVTMRQYLPTGDSTPVQTIRVCDETGSCSNQDTEFGWLNHLGNTVFLIDRPCATCGQGCYVNATTGSFGHPTFWFDDKTRAQRGWGPPRDYDQATLDAKSLNCTSQLLFAAFCWWDGGRLPTQDELGSTTGVWGPNTFPWGDTPTSRDTWDPSDPDRILYAGQTDAWLVRMLDDNAKTVEDAPDRNTTNWNPFGWSVPQARYVFPARPFSKWDHPDQAFAIAAPGRMTRDRRSTGPGVLDGWFDVGGNLMEVAGDYSGDLDDSDHNGWPRVNWIGGSFEGHDLPNRAGYNLNILAKYGKQGARCARPTN